jgi:hypothetical protein
VYILEFRTCQAFAERIQEPGQDLVKKHKHKDCSHPEAFVCWHDERTAFPNQPHSYHLAPLCARHPPGALDDNGRLQYHVRASDR